MPLQIFDERFPIYAAVQFTSADTPGVWASIVASNVYTRRWDVIQVCNTDTIAHDVGMDLIFNDGTSLNGFATAAAGVGDGALPPLDLLGALMPAAFHYVFTTPNENPAFTFKDGISAGKSLTVFLLGGAI